MTGLRLLIGALGVAGAAYGAIQLLDLGLDNLLAAGTWLIGGVLLHDGVLAPLTIVVCFVVATAMRGRVPAPVVVGAIVLGTVTVAAVPVLGRFGERPDNPTLLDRNYVLGWLVVATLVVMAAAAATIRLRMKGGARGQGAGRR
jgi:hypothetical protein